MEKVKALLIPNTGVVAEMEHVSVEGFTDAQEQMNNPMLVFCNLDTLETYKHFEIVAKDLTELNLMYKHKIFYTSSVPEGKKMEIADAVFLGVSKDYYTKKEQPDSTPITPRQIYNEQFTM